MEETVSLMQFIHRDVKGQTFSKVKGSYIGAKNTMNDTMLPMNTQVGSESDNRNLT